MLELDVFGYRARINELQAQEAERKAKEAEAQAQTDGSDPDKKPGSSISKTDKPKSGK